MNKNKHICKEKTGAMGRAFNDCLLNVRLERRLHSVCTRCSSISNRPY
ncbi:MAG: hypothetical protein HDR22_10150 [Lachnospiraceae bacterium]|nr:hypothetical protein [Lachnospiraceae bacterium]